MSSSPLPASDSGFTLTEVVVSMTVMTVAVTVFTAGFVQTFQQLNRTDAGATAQLQLDVAYRRLDRELRYASAVSKPAVIGSDAYVEYMLVQLAGPSTGPGGTATTTLSTCVQLRFSASTRRLLRRTWDPNSPSISPTAWMPLADAVLPGAAAPSPTQPFTLRPADATYNYERLRISLVSTGGSGSTAQARSASVTYSALNSDPTKTTDTVCSAGRSVP